MSMNEIHSLKLGHLGHLPPINENKSLHGYILVTDIKDVLHFFIQKKHVILVRMKGLFFNPLLN